MARAFCGFYVAKADTKLFNKASQVVLVRDGDRTVLTMANDYEGEPKDFAVVIPVPTVIKKEAVQVVEKAAIDHLDAYSAPRLVEYFDRDPCSETLPDVASGPAPGRHPKHFDGAKALGVKIEEKFSVGEYDILVLSAEQSDGLETWLTANGYKIPKGAGPVLASYIKQNVKFFVAKVNIARHEAGGFTFLRPLRVEFKTPKFMLPIRLGTVNANGPQELFIYTLTRKGRVETTNYRTVKLSSDLEVPLYVRDEFPRFYRDLFARAVQREDMRVLFTEYAWDMGWCDPCAADPMTNDELRKFGADWLRGKGSGPAGGRGRSFSPACTCATTASISRRTSSSRKRVTSRRSRAATPCGIRGKGSSRVRTGRNTWPSSPKPGRPRRRIWPASPAGKLKPFANGWRNMWTRRNPQRRDNSVHSVIPDCRPGGRHRTRREVNSGWLCHPVATKPPFFVWKRATFFALCSDAVDRGDSPSLLKSHPREAPE